MSRHFFWASVYIFLGSNVSRVYDGSAHFAFLPHTQLPLILQVTLRQTREMEIKTATTLETISPLSPECSHTSQSRMMQQQPNQVIYDKTKETNVSMISAVHEGANSTARGWQCMVAFFSSTVNLRPLSITIIRTKWVSAFRRRKHSVWLDELS